MSSLDIFPLTVLRGVVAQQSRLPLALVGVGVHIFYEKRRRRRDEHSKRTFNVDQSHTGSVNGVWIKLMHLNPPLYSEDVNCVINFRRETKRRGEPYKGGGSK